MKALQLKDFLNYKFLSQVKMSPNGEVCAFVVTTCDEENNAYKQNIHLLKNGNCIQLTQSDKDCGVMFLDDDTILFRSNRNASKDEVKTSFYTMSLLGGEAKHYFDIPLVVKKIEMLNDKEFVLLVCYDNDFSYVGRENQKDELLKAKKESVDYEVFTKIPFCHNGGGYAKNTSSRLYKYHVETKELTL